MRTSSITEAKQYLTFNLQEETFAVDVGQVREVLEFNKVTKVPRTPDYMRGVINLRGNVVPVVDLNLKFGKNRTEATVETCIVVLEVAINGERTVVGALADSVQEVVELVPEDIEAAPRLGTRMNMDFILGMGKQTDGSFVIILDIDKVFSEDEVALFQDITEEHAGEAATMEDAGS